MLGNLAAGNHESLGSASMRRLPVHVAHHRGAGVGACENSPSLEVGEKQIGEAGLVDQRVAPRLIANLTSKTDKGGNAGAAGHHQQVRPRRRHPEARPRGAGNECSRRVCS